MTGTLRRPSSVTISRVRPSPASSAASISIRASRGTETSRRTRVASASGAPPAALRGRSSSSLSVVTGSAVAAER